MMAHRTTAPVGADGGDDSSWETLVTQVRPVIIAYARSRGISDAEDVAQDVFADVVERLPTFSGSQADLRSFLFTVAHRRIADRHRRLYRLAELNIRNPVAEALPEDWVVDRDEVSWARQALGELDERSQRVLVLRFIEEQGHAEIAQQLGLTETNVRAIQSRALKRLRKILQKPHHGPGRRAMTIIVTPLAACFRRGHGHEGTGPPHDWITALRTDFGRFEATSNLPHVGTASGATASPQMFASTSALTATTAATTAASASPLVNVVTAAVIAVASAVAGTAAVTSTGATPVEPAAASTALANTDNTAVTASEPDVADDTGTPSGSRAPTIDIPTSVDVTIAVDVATTTVNVATTILDVVASTDGNASADPHNPAADALDGIDPSGGIVIDGPATSTETGIATPGDTPAQLTGDSPSATASIPATPIGAPTAPPTGLQSTAGPTTDAVESATTAADGALATAPGFATDGDIPTSLNPPTETTVPTSATAVAVVPVSPNVHIETDLAMTWAAS